VNDGFRGHVEECIKHLAARILEVYPRGTLASTEVKRPIAEFCGVNIHSVTSWFFRGNHLPRGEQYIKLMCFLDLNGYKVIELERMSIKCKNFTKLIGYSLIRSEDAIEMLGYTQVSDLFRALRGNTGFTPEKEEKLWDLWKARKDQLDEAVEEASLKFRLNFSRTQNQEVVELSAVMPTDSKPSNCPKEGVIEIMHGLLMLLDSGILQDLSDTDWAALRTSSSTILRLSSHLSTLSAKLVRPSERRFP
jgi:hypothetical protein